MSAIAQKRPLWETLQDSELSSSCKSTANALQSKYQTPGRENDKFTMNLEVARFLYDFLPLITTERPHATSYNILARMCGRQPVPLPSMPASPEATRLVAGLSESQIRGILGTAPPSGASMTAEVAGVPPATLSESSLARTQTFWEWAVDKVVEAGTVVRDGAVAGASVVYNGAADSALWMQSFLSMTPAQQQQVRVACTERLAEMQSEQKS